MLCQGLVIQNNQNSVDIFSKTPFVQRRLKAFGTYGSVNSGLSKPWPLGVGLGTMEVEFFNVK